jgi:hypothetical protein
VTWNKWETDVRKYSNLAGEFAALSLIRTPNIFDEAADGTGTLVIIPLAGF